MRCLLVVCVLGSTASADPKLTFDALSKGQRGDWTAFESERLEGTTLVKERVIAQLDITAEPKRHVQWFRGQPDAETFWDSPTFYSLHELLSDIGGKPDAKLTKTTCGGYACTKLTFTDEPGASSSDTRKITVTASFSTRIRGSGIIELEARQGTDLRWRLKAIGYGTVAKTEWGVKPTTSKLEVPPPRPMLKGDGLGRSLGNDLVEMVHVAPLSGPIGPITVKSGALDKAIIRRYLKRNSAKLMYCYEKELLAKPKLVGKVAIAFTIGTDGLVSASTGNGVDPEVSKCAAGVVKNIEFPKPKGTMPVEAELAITYEPPVPPGKKI